MDKKALKKTLTWRILATTDTMLIAFILTGSIATSISIGGLEVITKSVLYYLHELFWKKR